MEQVLLSLSNTIIDESVKNYHKQIQTIIPNVFFLKTNTSNYFDFINSISDSALLSQLKQIDLLSLNSRLKTLLYHLNSPIKYNQNLLVLWLGISTSNDIVIKHVSNGNKLILLSPDNILKTNQANTNQANTNQAFDIGIIKYKLQTSVLQMNNQTSQLLINGVDVDIFDIIKNILTN